MAHHRHSSLFLRLRGEDKPSDFTSVTRIARGGTK